MIREQVGHKDPLGGKKTLEYIVESSSVLIVWRLSAKTLAERTTC